MTVTFVGQCQALSRHAERLGKLGIRETPEDIANKISRGGFTAVFLVQCLTEIGAKELRL